MADPIKTTVQEALDHIKQWISEGSKEKALQGLNEILSFDPQNADAKKLLAEIQGVPAATMATAQTTPAITTSTSQTPAPTPTPAPKPAPAMPTSPVAPIMPPAPTPAPVSAAAPQVPTATSSAPAPMPPKATPITMIENESNIEGLAKNVKIMILIGGIVIAVIGGYIFYRNFISAPASVIEDLQNEFQNTETPDTIEPTTSNTLESTPPSIQSPIAPATDTSTSTDTTLSTDSTTSNDGSSVVESTSEKVKRR